MRHNNHPKPNLERYETAHRLRNEGKTFREIGAALGVGKQRAQQMVKYPPRSIRHLLWGSVTPP